jgi:hypothetical protein
MLQRYSRQVLTAGKADEVVADAGGPIPNHSVFTDHFIQGLQGKAATGDGVITANGVMAYVYDRVAKDLHSQQTPHYGFLDGDGDFIFKAPSLNELTETDRLGMKSESEKEDSALNLIFAGSSDIKLFIKPVLAAPERVHYGQEMITVQTANAVNILCEHMRSNMPEVNIIQHVSRHQLQDLMGSIIIIGGPFGNPTASKFLKELSVDIEFFRDTPKNVPHSFMIKVGKDYFTPVQKSNGELIDYGLFLVGGNPFDPSSKIVLCISTHAYGTYAATYFSLTNFAAKLAKQFENGFVAVVECWVDTSEGESPEIKVLLPPKSKVNSYPLGALQW